MNAIRRHDGRGGITLQHRGKRLRHIAALLLVLHAFAAFDLFSLEDPDVSRGNELYNDGKFTEAVERYDSADKRLKRRGGEEYDKKRHVIYFNKGCALYRQGQFEKAGEELLKAVGSPDDDLRAAAYYNLGDVALTGVLSGSVQSFKEALDKVDSAIDFYKRSLRIRPADRDAAYNLEVAFKVREEIEKKQKEQEEQQKNQPQDQQQQDQQQAGNDQQQQQQDQQGQPQDQQQQQQGQDQQQQADQGQQQDQQKTGDEQQQEQQQQEQQQARQGQDQQGEQQQAQQAQAVPLNEQQAKELLDSLREGEKPFKVFMFDMNENQQAEDGKAGGGGDVSQW